MSPLIKSILLWLLAAYLVGRAVFLIWKRAKERRRGWRVWHSGRDLMHYSELRDGKWATLEIDGEMLTGKAHHVIYFRTPSKWDSYPEWARPRREEIIGRIKSEFKAPGYEYDNA